MKEMIFGSEGIPTAAEVLPMKVENLEDGLSTGWENEQQFTIKEILAIIKTLDVKAENIQVIEQVINHAGVLVAAYMRTPGSTVGYGFMLKGKHGYCRENSGTSIEYIDYVSESSNKVDFAQTIGTYLNGAWVK